jgi:hypothetical protein
MSTSEPQLTFRMAAVMALARAEAANAATFATSSSVGRRFSNVAVTGAVRQHAFDGVAGLRG